MSGHFNRLLITGLALFLLAAVCPAQTAATKKTKKLSAKSTSATRSTSHSASKLAPHSAHSGKLVPAASKKKITKSKKKKRANWRSRGQQKIDAQRTKDIQDALIREHYLDGTASGVWDDKSQKAMQKFQADNGWQSKMTPDSRALIKLGLGPDHAHLLNPESAMTTTPDATHAADAQSKSNVIPSVSALPVMERAPSSRKADSSADTSSSQKK